MAKLKRVLGFWEAALAGVGVIMGAGIYSLLGAGAGLAGNGIWLSLIICAVLAALTGLSYAELSSMMPKAGAEFSYAEKAFGKKIAFLAGWLFIVSGVVGCTAISLGFAGYLHVLAGTPIILAAFALMLASIGILLVGVRESALLAIIFTLVEAVGLLIIIVLAVPSFGSVDYLAFKDLGGTIGAAALLFFAFIGFEDIPKLAEETRRASKTIPRALLAAIAVSVVLYILVGIAAVSMVGADSLAASKAPLADVAGKALGPNGFLLLSIIGLFATSNTVIMLHLATSRVAYGMAREKALPKKLAALSRRGVPWLATVAVGIIAALFLFAGDISFAAKITDFAIFAVFIIVNLAVVKLRFSAPNAPRPFKIRCSIGRVPLVPVLGMVSCFLLLLSLGEDIILGGLILAIAGAAVHLLFRAR